MSYSIRDLEQLSGIKAHTLRIWEQRYSIIVPKRTQTNIRFYDDKDLKKVLNIALLTEYGFRISKIANMSPDDIQGEVMAITSKNYKYPEQIQALTIAMIDLDEGRFEKVIGTNILHFGFEKTMINIVFPFMTRIGVLWQTGSINPVHEHFISALIRQKMIVAIDGIPAIPAENAKKFLLFLPEGELHETTLLFANYMIRARRHKAIYLGQNLPFEDVKIANQIYEPDYIVCIVTTTPGLAEIQPYVTKLGKTFPNTEILLSGYQVIGQDLALEPNTFILNHFESLISLLEEIGEEY